MHLMKILAICQFCLLTLFTVLLFSELLFSLSIVFSGYARRPAKDARQCLRLLLEEDPNFAPFKEAL